MSNGDLMIDGDVVRKRYLRTDRGQPAREWAALALLQQQAPLLAPRPIARETQPPVVVMSRVQGAPLDDVLTRPQTQAMVTAYRSLYAVPVPPDLALRFRDPAAFIAHTVDWLDETARDDVPDVVRRALDAAAMWYADAPTGIDEIRDPVVAQGDGNVANMLWDGQRVRLVDFEYAGVGDLAFEVADLVEHASSRLRSLLDPVTVIAGFDLTDAQLARVEAYRIVLASFWLLMLLPGNPGHDLNPPGNAPGIGRAKQTEFTHARHAARCPSCRPCDSGVGCWTTPTAVGVFGSAPRRRTSCASLSRWRQRSPRSQQWPLPPSLFPALPRRPQK